MRHSVSSARVSQEVPNCDDVRPRMAKAAIAVTPSHTTLLDVIEDLILNAPEKKEDLAERMKKDRAQMYRQVKSGNLTANDLAALGPDFYVRLGQAVLDAFGPMTTPQARLRAIRRQQRQLDHELDQLLEHIA
jgi:hypothetical protein